jgi:hypothetical protein
LAWVSQAGRLRIISLVLRHKEFNLKSSREPKLRNYFKFTLVILVLGVNLSFHTILHEIFNQNINEL